MPTLVHITTAPESLWAFFHGQIGYMKERGFAVHGIASPGPLLARFAEREQVLVHAVEMPRRITPLRDLAAVARLVRELRAIRPQIVHAHTPKGGLLGMIAATLARVPVRVYHIHGLPLMTATGHKRALLWWSEKIACTLAQRVLCVSPSVRAVAVAEGLCPPAKISVPAGGSINGVDALGQFDPDRVGTEVGAATRARYNIPQDAPVLGFVGRIVRDKGLVELAAAWQTLREEFPDLHLLIVGPFEPQDPVPAEVEHLLRHDTRIHLTGQVEDTPRLYAAMDMVTLPSYREGLGMSALEAASMRLPVVASRIPGCIDVVQDGVTGTLVPCRDAVALASALRRYIMEPALRRAHGQAARNRMLREFRQEVVWAAVYDEYTHLLQAQGLADPATSASLVGVTTKPKRGGTTATAKRAFDLALTIPALVLFAPLLLLLALLVRRKLGSPVLFRQQRPGLHGRPFTVLKFRTMIDARDAEGQLLPDAMRLTAFGRFLRSSSLDELPELINVLKGEMSLVGPRPLLMQYLARYTPEQRRRHALRPGITGWAQVNGRNTLDWEARFALDLWYVDHQSLGLDLQIILRTIGKVLRRTDISQAGHATMSEFQGAQPPAQDGP